MIRFGLCCLFREAPIHFRTTTATHFKSLSVLSALLLDNAHALEQALLCCEHLGIYAFRVTSFEGAFERLSPSARAKLTLENDDKCYTPVEAKAKEVAIVKLISELYES